MPIYPQPKGRPAKLEKADRTAKRVDRDDKESKKVRERSKGRCEMWEGLVRCTRRAVHVHHLLGGIGVRGRGDSAEASRKLHLCNSCHSDLHSHVLVRHGGLTPHYQDCYERVK